VGVDPTPPPPAPPPPHADRASISAQAVEAMTRLFIAYSPASRWNLTAFPKLPIAQESFHFAEDVKQY
jgi:hypothetical protein